jgi:hypothetical protein
MPNLRRGLERLFDTMPQTRCRLIRDLKSM